jgi:hypothetical protein
MVKYVLQVIVCFMISVAFYSLFYGILRSRCSFRQCEIIDPVDTEKILRVFIDRAQVKC